MSDCIKIDTELFAPCTSSGTQTNIVPPTTAGQIPVAEADPTTGTLQYIPKLDPLLSLNPADARKALTVDATDPNNIVLKGIDAIVDDEAVRSLLDQTGVVGFPEITFTAPNVLKLPQVFAVFGDGTTRQVVSAAAQDLTITRSGTGTATDDFTYITLDKNGQYAQLATKPAPDPDKQFVCEVYHPDGGPIINIRPFWTYYSNPQDVSQEVGGMVGLADRDFAFTRTAASGAVRQVGSDARLVGYNIRASGFDRNVLPFPVADIAAEYYSVVAGDRVPTLNNFNRTYKLDDPVANTSAALPNFGILVIMAGLGGKYMVVAPQRNFATLEAAQVARTSYAASIILPTGLSEFYTAVATVVVSPTVTSSAGTFDVASIGEAALMGGSTVTGPTLPAPSTGAAGDVVVVNPTTDSYVLKTSVVPDLTGTGGGEYLKVQGGAIVTEQPSAANIDFFYKRQDMRFFLLTFNTAGAVTGTSGDTTYFNSAGFTVAVSNKQGDNGDITFTLPRGTNTSPIAIWSVSVYFRATTSQGDLITFAVGFYPIGGDQFKAVQVGNAGIVTQANTFDALVSIYFMAP